MATRQYIGARYVPIIDKDPWNNTKAYDPLTVVMYQGNSYTSRTFVPAGIDISNSTYWALTGNYNAQVEVYRQEVLRLIDVSITAYDTIADIIADTDILEGQYVSCSGYYTINDGGYGVYLIVSDGNYQITLDNGLYGRLIHGGTVSIAQFGASQTDGLKTKAALDAILANNIKHIIVPKGNWLITGTVTLNNGVAIDGESKLYSQLTETDITANMFEIGDEDNNVSVIVKNIQLWNDPSQTVLPNKNTGTGTGASNIAIHINKGITSLFENVKINRFQYAVKIEDSNYTIDFNHCQLHSNDYGIFAGDTVQAINILECDFDNDMRGIRIGGGIGSIVVDKCQLENCYIAVTKLTNGDITITDCYFDANGFRSIILSGDLSKVVIANNKFLEALVNSTMIDATGATAGEITCVDNDVSAGEENATAFIAGATPVKFNMRNHFRYNAIFCSNTTRVVNNIDESNLNAYSIYGSLASGTPKKVLPVHNQRIYADNEDYSIDFSDVGDLPNHSHIVIETRLYSGKTITFQGTGATFQNSSYTNNSGSTEYLIIYCVKVANGNVWDNLILKDNG